MRSYSDALRNFPKLCGTCGRTIPDQAAWERLKYIGEQVDDYERLEMRNHDCGSTLAIRTAVFKTDDFGAAGGDTPPKAWVEKFVKAAALNTLASRGAPIQVQQRVYVTFMRLRLEGEKRWPKVDFERGLEGAVQVWLREHPMSGPGKDW